MTATEPACWRWPLPTVLLASAEEGYAFLRWWNRACAICGAETQLVEDHDHDSMWLRGWLCPRCNRSEGHDRAAGNSGTVYCRYRERCPAIMLGVEMRYGSYAHRRAIAKADLTGDEQPAVPAGQMKEVADARVAASLRSARLRVGLSQQQATVLMRARGFTYHQQTFSRIEGGQQMVSASECLAFAQIYGTTIGLLVGEADYEVEEAADPAA